MSISNQLLSVTQNNQAGYHPLMNFESWRVATLNGGNIESVDSLEYVEYHGLTDEVFILTRGKGALIIAEGDKSNPTKYHCVPMEYDRCYNVIKDVWHAILLDDEGSVIIVENHNTSEKNSGYHYLSSEDKAVIAKAVEENPYL